MAEVNNQLPFQQVFTPIFVAGPKSQELPSASSSGTQLPTTLETHMITGRVRVVKGRNSVFSLALNRTTSNEYKVYTSTFEEQVIYMFYWL